MRIFERLMLRKLKLPAARRYPVSVRRNLRVPMADDVELLADWYAPKGLDKPPVIMVRSPYGKRHFAATIGLPLAQQGFQVLIQCCRGTGGSGGVFDPHHDEHDDGLSTIEWIKRQPGYGGSIATFGMSYLGYTQWAVARDAGPEVKAMAMQVTLAGFSRMTYAGGSLMLANAFGWTNMMSNFTRPAFLLRMMLSNIFGFDMITTEQWKGLPLEQLDEGIAGQRVPFWRDWMRHDSMEDPWWAPMDFHPGIAEVRRPISMVAGWHDIFVPWQLQDFIALRKAGCPARLTVGPWQHTDFDLMREGLIDALGWFRAHLLGDASALREKPVRLYIQGAEEWRHFDDWPPPESRSVRWQLQPEFGLSILPAPMSPPDSYRYDPAEPTPSIGGPALFAKVFNVDNEELEARADVLCYTSAPLPGGLDIAGVVEAELHVSSDVVSADFFVRLCDVDTQGISRDICDGLQRIAMPAANTPTPIKVQLWPTAYRFKPGHRLRVQISSGAFPRWARNPGSGEALGTASQLMAATQTIYHDPQHPSAIVLPVLR